MLMSTGMFKKWKSILFYRLFTMQIFLYLSRPMYFALLNHYVYNVLYIALI